MGCHTSRPKSVRSWEAAQDFAIETVKVTLDNISVWQPHQCLCKHERVHPKTCSWNFHEMLLGFLPAQDFTEML